MLEPTGKNPKGWGVIRRHFGLAFFASPSGLTGNKRKVSGKMFVWDFGSMLWLVIDINIINYSGNGHIVEITKIILSPIFFKLREDTASESYSIRKVTIGKYNEKK